MADLDLTHRPKTMRTFEVEAATSYGEVVHLERLPVTNRRAMELVRRIAQVEQIRTYTHGRLSVHVREVSQVHPARRRRTRQRYSDHIRDAAVALATGGRKPRRRRRQSCFTVSKEGAL